MTQMLACTDNWLDMTNMTAGTTGCAVSTFTIGNCTPPSTTISYWPYYYPVYVSSPARPIKLTLSEVERLRKAAKDDSKLKSILQKFTGQIEITVDFD